MSFIRKILNSITGLARNSFNFEDFIRGFSVKKLLVVISAFLIILATYLTGSSVANLIGVLMFKPQLYTQKYIPHKIDKVDVAKELQAFEASVMDNTFSTEEAPEDLFSDGEKIEPVRPLTDFELRGTMVLGTFSAYAYIFQKSTSTEQFFLIGDIIFSTKLKLKKVFRTYVVLERNGEELELKYPESTTFDELNQLASADPKKPAAPGATAKPAAPAAKQLIERVTPGNAPVVNIENGKADVLISANDIENNLQNFTELLQQARVIPKNNSQGTLDGFLIRDIVKGSFYEQIGLKNQDVIKSVNGNPIDSPEKALTLFQLLRNEKQINLVLERNGQNIAFNYFIQ